MQDINPLQTYIEEEEQLDGNWTKPAQDMSVLLNLCWLAAQSVFEGKEKPEHAIALLPHLIAMSDAQAAKRPAAPAQDAALKSGSTSP